MKIISVANAVECREFHFYILITLSLTILWGQKGFMVAIRAKDTIVKAIVLTVFQINATLSL